MAESTEYIMMIEGAAVLHANNGYLMGHPVVGWADEQFIDWIHGIQIHYNIRHLDAFSYFKRFAKTI